MTTPCPRCGQATYGLRHATLEACLTAALEQNRNLRAALADRDAVLKHLATDHPPVVDVPMHA